MDCQTNSATNKPTVLVIAGSDSAGLAGIQADNRAIQAAGCHPLNIISAVTAQNNELVHSINPVPVDIFADQWNAVSQLKPEVIKIGLICSNEQIEFVLANIRANQRLVWDPVQISSSGNNLTNQLDGKLIKQLITRCDILTPNIAEACKLSARTNSTDQHTLAKALVNLGAKTIVITDGVQQRDDSHKVCADFVKLKQRFNTKQPSDSFYLVSNTVDTPNTRGTGCSFASLIAAFLAQGFYAEEAITLAKSALSVGLSNSFSLKGHEQTVKDLRGSTDFTPQHNQLELSFFNLSNLPRLIYDSQELVEKNKLVFPRCILPKSGSKEKDIKLGLYPVVDSAEWVARLLALDVKTIQLRIKNITGMALKAEIRRATDIAKEFSARLFINDHWQLAIECGSYGIHLGQEDLCALKPSELQAIHEAGLKLGISSHAYYEVASTLTLLTPSYLALGPIYPTTSKPMPWKNQGLARLKNWVESAPCSVVAIGGINESNIQAVADVGASGIAMISAITEHENPEEICKTLMQALH